MAIAVGREYTETHPHIRFQVDLSTPAPSLWAFLGEAKSKSEHVARTLLKPDASFELMQVFLTKGVLATTAIEGNTLTEDEARRVVDGTHHLPPSKEYLAKEIENILAAYNQIKDELLADPDGLPFTPERLAEYNRLILDGLELEEGVVPGEVRDYPVTVGGIYKAAPARDCDYLVERLCDWLNGDDFTAPPDRPELAAPLAIIKAIVAHIYIAWIHPYGDGNGRTARLVELQVLLRAGFPTPTTQLLSNHYNLTRSAYYRELNRASQTGDLVPFAIYAARGFVDELRSQLDIIWQTQFSDRWEQHVYQTMGPLKTVSIRRRLRLALAISRAGRPVPRQEVRQLAPELAEAYAKLTNKAITRDLNVLRRLGLIERTAAGYVPENTEILGFMPDRADGVLQVEPVVPDRRLESPEVHLLRERRGAGTEAAAT
ncbi:MAG: hypothetical protein QOI91_2659 [Solirubrobacteraceae bacterium]|jgi:Fic family protein|nr:hypothetical protein [Solirubrobacteraceae bacterium]